MHHAIGNLFAAREDGDSLEQRKQDARCAILFTYWRIVLRLNRTEPMHGDLRQKLDQLMLVSDRVPDRQKVDEAVDLARQILKQEWNVTKYSIFTRPILWVKRYWGTN